jgi:hypothetical protein
MQWKAPSKPLAVDDPLLLPEREVHAEIGINWFLDSHPTGGYVRILAESLLWEERLQSLLQAVNRWIGEGEKATLVGAPDADILAAAIETLRKRIAVGTATFLVKVKAYRGELANEGADILADKAISDLKAGKEWCQRTNWAVFTWEQLCCEESNLA